MKKRMVLFLVVILLFLQVGCKPSEEKSFSSYVPPKTGEVDEAIKLDPENAITITDTRIEYTAKGEEILLVTYDWENLNDEKALIGESSYSLIARQDGVQLEGDLRLVEDKKKLVSELAAGETMEDIEQGFKLISDADVTLVLEGKVNYIFIDGVPAFNHPTEIPISIVDS